MATLPRRFYARDAKVVARALLGMHLLIRHPQGIAVGPHRRDRGLPGTG